VAGGPGSESESLAAPAGPRRAGTRLGVCRGQRLPRPQHSPVAPLTRSTSQWQVAPDSAPSPTPSRGRGRGRLLRPRTSLGHLLNELLIECQSEQAAMVSIPVDDSRDMRSCPLALASSPCHGPETCDSLHCSSVLSRRLRVLSRRLRLTRSGDSDVSWRVSGLGHRVTTLACRAAIVSKCQ
jgi:hypothetical protein